jgi:tetratricopeptide (TPR) repeat protein
MAHHHFISYSPSDGQDLAIQLCDALEAGPPSYAVWLDKRQLRPGDDWDEQIVEALRTAESLLFVMTRDSVDSRSVCKQEWTRALKYKKPIVPLLFHRDAEMPFGLGRRQYVDFTGTSEQAMAKLRTHLDWLASPEGMLHTMQDRQADAQRDLRHVNAPEERGRIEHEIALLNQQIAEQQRVVDDPQGTAQRVEESIARGLERERQPERPLSGVVRTKFINPPPGMAPSYFQDRFVETKLVGDFLKDESKRLMTVVGRAGIGKTAMVCRVLKSLEGGRLPDGGGPLQVDGIVYLSASGSRRVTVPNLYADLTRLLPDATANALDVLYKDPRATTEAKMRSLLEAFPYGCVVVLLDNFEDVIDPATHNIRDTELDEALRALLNLPHHAIKAMLTTRIAPYNLALMQPGRQFRLELEKGLESPYAENILREMDADGTVGLQTAPADLLDEARRRTLGYPRALEALFAILSADRYTTLREVLNDAEKLLPENVVEVLVGEAFNRLDPAAEKVMQALAVYARPVTPAAIDYLLQPHLPGVNSAPIANRLVNMHFARREAGRYYLHPVDRAYAFARIPEGEESDRLAEDSPPYTQFALLHRGAEYFKQARKPREDWKTIEDLAPQLAEFDLRYNGQDYDTAAAVLLDIDYDYLHLWGHYRLMVELHERLQGKLSDPQLKIGSVGNLGSAYYRMGQLRKAIACHEQALNNAREIKDRRGEGPSLGNLGLCYADLGQTARAIDYHEQALIINRETGDRRGEGIRLSNLGNCYANLGQTTRAIDYYEQALVIDQEIGERSSEAIALSNLGNCYADLGQTTRAMEYYEQSLGIAHEIRNRLMESANLAYKGSILVDQGEWEKAVELYNQAMQVADEIGNAQFQSAARKGLALAHLYAGDLPAARAVAETARQYDVPLDNHSVLGLLGVILLRHGDRSAAQEAFAAAVAHADALLTHTSHNSGALDTKGLALCGLVLCGEGAHLTAAVEAFQAGRAITQDSGIVQPVLRLLDALALADAAGVLAPVRAAAAGE